MEMPDKHVPGIGLAVLGIGIEVVLFALQVGGVNLAAPWVIAIGVIGVALVLAGVALEIRAFRKRRGWESVEKPIPAPDSAFIRTRGTSRVRSEDDYSEADTFADTGDDSDVSTKRSIHRPDARRNSEK